jgi:D-glycero-D-manno-heptose 1,7-bisphosphate phosphatase
MEGHSVWLAANPRRGVPALFVDRDGTVIEDPGFIADPDKVSLIPGAAASLRVFRDAGYALILVTNQSGIGRGLYRWSDYQAVAARFRELLAAEGVGFDAEFACAHTPEEGARCGWRKPGPGMIREAADRMALDLTRSVMAGDKLSDLEAGAAAGISRLVHVASGQGAAERGRVLDWRGPVAVTLLADLSLLLPCAS